ncbi:MAG: hypothetical protein NC111_00085 [Bacteroides sp.]|nr:hypothetical protein [Bacteroides sp.]MCM1412791.1 hypothetical protein [Bacteroides sp.]MCM1470915.1 hypothetical protein [Bacteroides sp.]
MEFEKKTSKMPQLMRNIFGVVMVLIFVAVGVLCLIGFFPTLTGKWTWLRYVGGVVFILYGIWRGYRQFKGIDEDVTTRYE